MTEQELRDLPLGSDVWYALVKLFKVPSVRIRYNKKPIHLRKVKEEVMTMTNICVGCYFEDDNGTRFYRHYRWSDHDCLFTEEKSAWEYYDEQAKKAMKEIYRRRRAYCDVAKTSLEQLDNSRVIALFERLNRGDADAD